ncbi:MAG TPA: BON domain-containing protein [Pyrinomonadaceae bacterium]|nr:BON domain-containing protein [Pyrinomonadaceae bacterium]
MSYDEEQQRRSRVVVNTPTERREVDYQQTRYVPERGGYSTGVVVAVALTAIAATAIIFLFMMNSGDEMVTNQNTTVRTTAPVAQTTPLILQQSTPLPTPFPTLPPTTTTTAPGVIVPPADATLPPATTTAPAPASTPNAPDEATIRQSVNAKIQADADLAATDILADISGNKATLTGTVRSADLKRRAERLAISVRGVRVVDNQITVQPAPEPAGTP